MGVKKKKGAAEIHGSGLRHQINLKSGIKPNSEAQAQFFMGFSKANLKIQYLGNQTFNT